MKKISILFGVLLSIAQIIGAQSPSDVILKDIPVTYFGIDFTKAKGVMLDAASSEVIDKYMPEINQLMLNEPSKFHFAESFNKTQFKYDIADVNKLNASMARDSFQYYTPTYVEPIAIDTITSMVQKYSLAGKTGIGMVFIAQRLDKHNLKAVYKLVFFSLPEGKIIINEQVTGIPNGFGFRNYWGNTIYYILKSETDRVKTKYSNIQ
jgi:hypothetical protein